MEDVISSVNQTDETGRENGGHSIFGDKSISFWKEGGTFQKFTSKDGDSGYRATVSQFKKTNGDIYVLKDYSAVEFHYHIHPCISQIRKSGLANPSDTDLLTMGDNYTNKFRGTAFVIGLRSNKVQFYGDKKSYITISYEVYKKIRLEN